MIRERLFENLKKARYIGSFRRETLVHVNLQILYQCNFRCRICDFWQPPFPSMPKMSAAQVGLISEKLADIGPQIVSIGGGEPLMHKQLLPIIRALSRHHFPVMICNGWFVTPEKARAMWEAGMYEISISVDYHDAAQHDAQRGIDGAYDRAIEALEILHRTRTRPWQRVHMISVVMDDNLDHIEPLIQLSERLGITYVITLYSDKRGALRARASNVDIADRLLELKRRYKGFVQLHGYLAGFPTALSRGGVPECHAGKNLCNVDCQGDVSLCIDRVDEPVANIFEQDMESVYQALLRRYQENTCADCWTSCRGTVETLMYRSKPRDYLDYFQLTRSVPLEASA